MHQIIIHEKFPVFIAKVDKSDCCFRTLDEVVDYFVKQVESHPVARLIGVFDHYAHTSALADGEIAPGIVGAMNIVVCFGMAIPQPEILALRPRSIGIADVGGPFRGEFSGDADAGREHHNGNVDARPFDAEFFKRRLKLKVYGEPASIKLFQ